MDPPLLTRLLAAVFFLAANAFFVAAEFALVKVRRSRIEQLSRTGDRLARAVEASLEDLDRSISGTQLGITVASLGLGWVGEPAIARPLHGLFQELPGAWAGVLTHSTAVVVAFLLLTFLHIVLGELAPKSVALLRPERVSRLVALPLNTFNRIVQPAVAVLNGTANLIVRSFGWGTPDGEQHVHSPEEIQILLRRGLEEGIVEQDEEAMIHGVFELTRTVAREVMTPRTEVVAIPVDATIDEVLETAARSGYSRFPVYRESLDEIEGVLLVKDLLPWLRGDRDGPRGFRADRVAREAIYVPDTKPVDDLLAELRRRKVHMAVVLDEFGGTDGIVTLEDLVEEIVGDIYDEHDVARSRLRVEEDGRILVDGGVSLSELLDRFELPDEGDAYDTVAGYVMGELGRIPEPGERVSLDSGELEVVEIEDRRVKRVRLHFPPGDEAGSAEDDEGTQEDAESGVPGAPTGTGSRPRRGDDG